jgi:hypothetical protein
MTTWPRGKVRQKSRGFPTEPGHSRAERVCVAEVGHLGRASYGPEQPAHIMLSGQKAPSTRSGGGGEGQADPWFRPLQIDVLVVLPLVFALPSAPDVIVLAVISNTFAMLTTPIIVFGLLWMTNNKRPMLRGYTNRWCENPILVASAVIGCWASYQLVQELAAQLIGCGRQTSRVGPGADPEDPLRRPDRCGGQPQDCQRRHGRWALRGGADVAAGPRVRGGHAGEAAQPLRQVIGPSPARPRL